MRPLGTRLQMGNRIRGRMVVSQVKLFIQADQETLPNLSSTPYWDMHQDGLTNTLQYIFRLLVRNISKHLTTLGDHHSAIYGDPK